MPCCRKVAIALSGGVDSAVAAALLRRQGWDLHAVHLRLSPLAPPPDRVEALAQGLNIPLTVVDLQQEFAREVLDYFVSGMPGAALPTLASGATPPSSSGASGNISRGRALPTWPRAITPGFTRLAMAPRASSGGWTAAKTSRISSAVCLLTCCRASSFPWGR